MLLSMEQKRIPKPGEIYRHFKNRLYQIVTVASHSETGEQLVIYQALYGSYMTYARPLDMFCSEVDRNKYPDVKQKYRFEPVDRQMLTPASETKEEDVEREDAEDFGQPAEVRLQKDAGRSGMNEEVNPDLLKFLEAGTYVEKLEILKSLKRKVSDRLISDIAVSLDVVADEGTIEERYEAVKHCLEANAKFECNRLR
ncbi:Protein of unknown function [Anaerobium acetethylicum]|uniref:DUF1653 domain-containing protein n=2 Tax=Anaerobium acetethylicum TaxID=1619234 RepID=A0A1D3TPA7_9FIRM|nr:Protein of unknown function [Anaerobium acetethylicum]